MLHRGIAIIECTTRGWPNNLEGGLIKYLEGGIIIYLEGGLTISRILDGLTMLSLVKSPGPRMSHNIMSVKTRQS